MSQSSAETSTSSGTSAESAPCMLKNVRSPVPATVITSVKVVGTPGTRATRDTSSPFSARKPVTKAPASSSPTLPSAATRSDGSSVLRSTPVLHTDPPTARVSEVICTRRPFSGHVGMVFTTSLRMLPANTMLFMFVLLG